MSLFIQILQIYFPCKWLKKFSLFRFKSILKYVRFKVMFDFERIPRGNNTFANLLIWYSTVTFYVTLYITIQILVNFVLCFTICVGKNHEILVKPKNFVYHIRLNNEIILHLSTRFVLFSLCLTFSSYTNICVKH